VVAVTHVTRGYNLGSLVEEGVNSLMRDMKYIYPPSPNVSRVEPFTGYYC
jgi:hypothetical protein